VVIDPQERKRSIMEDGQRKAQAVGGALIPNERLLEEVSGLVEYPRPILGAFDERYLELPAEVLLTSMESHQKSFGVRGPEGQLLNHFLTVLNIEPEDVELVRKGWQRVLKARLEDARFFWEDDIKASFDDWLAKLEHVVFLGPLGSMADKSRRIEMLCAWLATPHGAPLTDELPVAGKYAKCDLVSEMVYEFDTLQGIMGGIYARRQGMPENVARAIYEQYLPAGAESSVPETLPGALLSMADKMDTLVGIFGLDKAPTGAADPYALRRAALAVSRIIIEHDLRIDLDSFIEKAIDGYAGRELKLSPAETTAKLKDFFAGRLKALFTGQGMDTLVVEAAIGAGITDIRTLAMRLAALDEFSRRPDFEQSVLTFKRAANIIRKQGAEAGVKLTGRYEESLLQEEAERKLAARIHEVAPRFEELWAADAYGELLKLLGELRPSVDEFFDNVMVMADDPKLKLNRLNLLEALVAMLGRLADFNALQV
jgi:glycyl-tRNA synthetase beta chain